MRLFVSSLIAAAGLAGLAAPALAQAGPKIAFIDSRKVIAEAPGAKEAQAAFEKEMGSYEAQLKPLADSIQSLMSEYDQKAIMLSPDAKKQKEEQIRQKQAAFQQKRAQLEQQAEKRQAELVQPIMAKIQQVISDLRKEGGYTVIFDAAAAGIVAADPALDITEQVLTRLKATAAVTPAETAPKKP
ncbi:MAG: OmpH family outer membrane protein [Gemmatimonadetes bacterium]|nr:OmpH family outer membrane protein [Gemmatimonadota bacterium]